MSSISVVALGAALSLSVVSLACGTGKAPESPESPASIEEPEISEADAPEDVTDPPDAAPVAPATANDVIEAYFAAVEAGDKDAAHALLTGEELEGAKTSKKSFTYVFFEMGFKVKTWKLKSDVEEDGDVATGSVKAVLIDDEGKDDNEGMRFKLVRKDGKWLIAEIN